MKTMHLRCHLLALLGAGALLSPFGAVQGQQPQPPHYKIIDLGAIGLANPGPIQISNPGLIAEAITAGTAMHAAISFQGGTPIDLAGSGGLGGPNSAAFGVNAWGMAAGEAETTDSNLEDFCSFGTQQVCQPFVWRMGVIAALPLLTNATGSTGCNGAAKTLNAWGEVGGVAENATADTTCPAYNPTLLQFQISQEKPVVWIQGAIQELTTSGTDSTGNAFDDPDGVVFRINNRGEAVGTTGVCTGFSGFSYVSGLHAVLWRNGAAIDLGNLGGVATPPPGSGLGNFGNFAYNINQRGHVTGVAGTADGSAHAFLWTPKHHMQDVGAIPASATTPADVASIGLAISDRDDVGGISFPAAALPRAFLRLHGGTPLDLNTLVADNPAELYLFTACSISANGEIVGLALDPAGNFHGYLAIPQ